MKTKNLLLALALLATLGAQLSTARAGTVFPIATNGTIQQAALSAAFGVTNYLAGIEGDAVIGHDLTAQLISTNGSMIGSRIALGRTGGIPFAGFDGTNFMLVWDDDATYPINQIYGQRVSQSGALLGSPFTFGPTSQAQGMHGLQPLAFDGRNYLAVWDTGASHNATNGNVYAALFSPAGSLVVPIISITTGAIAAIAPSVVFGKTNYLVAWSNRRAGSTELYDIYGKFISTNGAQDSAFTISQTTSMSYNPCSAAFDGTNFFVVWNKDTGVGLPPNQPNYWNVYGRLVSPAGTFPGNETAMITDTNNPMIPALAFDGVNYLLAWHAGLTNSQIFSQFFNRSAVAIGPEFTLFSPQGTNEPVFGGVLFDGNRFLVTGIVGGFGGSGFTGSSSTWGTFIPKSTAAPTVTATSSLVGTQFPLQLTGTPGINYAVQVATNLASPNWTALVTNSPTNGTFSFTDTHATNKSRFYRAVKQ